MNTARDAVAAAVLNDKIYVCGGFDNDTLKTVEVYDPETDRYFRDFLNWYFELDKNIGRNRIVLHKYFGVQCTTIALLKYWITLLWRLKIHDSIKVYDPKLDNALSKAF